MEKLEFSQEIIRAIYSGLASFYSNLSIGRKKDACAGLLATALDAKNLLTIKLLEDPDYKAEDFDQQISDIIETMNTILEMNSEVAACVKENNLIQILSDIMLALRGEE